MAKGIDCATPLTFETASALGAEGVVFAGRYLAPKGSWKRLTRGEAEVISESGLQIVSAFERYANRAAEGGRAGREDGEMAYELAQEVGQPAGTVLYPAVDYDAQPSAYDAIEEYFHAIGEGLPGYELGGYGSFAVCEEMFRRGVITHIWQTRAWSGTQVSKMANIYQYRIDTPLAGVNVDLNDSYGGEGWWNTLGYQMKPEDANKIISLLGGAYGATTDDEAKEEFHRLANELRKASGQPEE